MAAEAEDSFQDDDIPPGNGCDGTACPSGEGVGGGEPAEVGGPCDDAGHCQSGVCAASFAQSAPGELLCQESCIGPMDTAMWCSDSAACCGAAVCSARGFCIPQDSDNENSDNDGSDGTGGSDGTTGGSETTTGASSGSTG